MLLGLALTPAGHLQEIAIWQKHATDHQKYVPQTRSDQTHIFAEYPVEIVTKLRNVQAQVQHALLI